MSKPLHSSIHTHIHTPIHTAASSSASVELGVRILRVRRIRKIHTHIHTPITPRFTALYTPSHPSAFGSCAHASVLREG